MEIFMEITDLIKESILGGLFAPSIGRQVYISEIDKRKKDKWPLELKTTAREIAKPKISIYMVLNEKKDYLITLLVVEKLKPFNVFHFIDSRFKKDYMARWPSTLTNWALDRVDLKVGGKYTVSLVVTPPVGKYEITPNLLKEYTGKNIYKYGG